MSKTYEQVIKQIEVLNREAEKLKRTEIDGVVSRMKEAIRVYGITSEDLGLGGASPAKSKVKAKAGKSPKASKSKSPAAPKFRDEAGNIWVGRGPRPSWLREALLAGKKLSDFAV